MAATMSRPDTMMKYHESCDGQQELRSKQDVIDNIDNRRFDNNNMTT